MGRRPPRADPALRAGGAATLPLTTIDTDAFDAFEVEGWERAAGAYVAFFAPISAGFADALLDAAGIGADTRTLDVATGPGHVAAAALARGARVTAVDVAEAMVARARAALPGADVLRADVQALPFPDGRFDAVVAAFLLLHLSRPERAVEELARVLAPGGRLAVTVWDRPERARFLGVFLDAVAAAGAAPPDDVPPGPDVFRFADDAELAGVLEEAGLADVEVRTVELDQPFTTDVLWRALARGTVRMSALVRGQDGRTRARIRDELDRLVAGAGGTLRVSVKLGAGRKP